MPDAPTEAESQPEPTPASNPDTPEPSQGEATVTVENGRRRGRRRVMTKKKVKDEDGYLGKQIHLLSCLQPNQSVQSPKKKPCGNRSPKMNQNPRSSNLHPPNRQAAQRESLPQRRVREALPVSSRKLDRSRERLQNISDGYAISYIRTYTLSRACYRCGIQLQALCSQFVFRSDGGTQRNHHTTRYTGFNPSCTSKSVTISHNQRLRRLTPPPIVSLQQGRTHHTFSSSYICTAERH